jgi:hypothetical protein
VVGEPVGVNRITVATVDRLLHHAHLVTTKATATGSPRLSPARG